jgi:hypothetical protein
MIRQISFIIISLSIGLFSCRHPGSIGLISRVDSSKIPLDTIIYNNYLEAVDNESTFQFFLVAKVKDLNTGKTREICTKGDFLEGALHMEYKIDYDSSGIKKLENIQRKNKKRYFEFKDAKALNNLGLSNYSMDDLAEFEKSHNIDSLTQVVKNGKWSLAIKDDKTMLLYAHMLFNRGILTGENNCFGGILVHIEYKLLIEEKRKLDIMEKRMKLMNQKK